MHDDPEPGCSRIENDRADRGGADHHSAEEDRLAKPPVWIGCEHLGFFSLDGIVRDPSKLFASRSGASRFSTLADGLIDLKHASLNFGAELWRSFDFLGQNWLDAAQVA
jgi:hypothetical protein